jgi:hypothetical protein
MSQSEPENFTQHALLVAWGQFAQCLGLVREIMALVLHQKKVKHLPQTKILEFFLAILAGLEYLKDLSQSAHPVAQDQAVAKAWDQPAWSDYSGVSRCLTELSQAEAEQIAGALSTISQPVIDREVMLALSQRGELVYDGDLTPRPVSNTSTSYPNAAHGHMGAGVGFGYQAALVSFHSPTYSRLWLSAAPHPGNVISCTQGEALVLVAEAKTSLRPRRRVELLAERLKTMKRHCLVLQQRLLESQRALQKAQTQLPLTVQELDEARLALTKAEANYRQRARSIRPHSQPGKLRRRIGVLERRQVNLSKRIPKLEKQVAFRQGQLAQGLAEEQRLRERLQRFEADNATNPLPIRAIFRLDAGFGTRENLALWIEMGYDVYTKPYSNWLTARLKRRVNPKTTWMQVGKNAEMVAWKALPLKDFPYPLDVGLERFYTGQTRRYASLIHFGEQPVTQDLPAWFHWYNARQTIEAGIKEGKLVFQMHHMKVRSQPGLFLQEQFAVFAANFVRWAARWLAEQCLHIPAASPIMAEMSVKKQVRVGAHTSAEVIWQEQGCLLRFSDLSIYAGRNLLVKKTWACQLALPFSQKVQF